jgi:hypothetical protein
MEPGQLARRVLSLFAGNSPHEPLSLRIHVASLNFM